MNITSEIFPAGSNFSDYLFYNNSMLEESFAVSSVVEIIIVLLGFLANCYVIWLILTGTGNGLAAEIFILNISVCEISLYVEYLLSHFRNKIEILWIIVGFLDGQATTGCPLFHCLMCVERYLAVVHPVTFLKFKPLRYRVICSIMVWMASLGYSGIIILFSRFKLVLYFVFLFAQFFLFLAIQLFCLVAVLRVLNQSGPGERGREKEQENHMKRRAFNLILITTVTMLILYCPYMIVVGLLSTTTVPKIVSFIGFVCFILAGLVQPFLFLYRVRKLPFIKYHF